MKYNYFPIVRQGNKWNDIKHYKELIPKNIDNLVEAFGGTFSLIRKLSDDDDFKIDKMIVYENDKKFINLFWHTINNIDKVRLLSIDYYNSVRPSKLFSDNKQFLFDLADKHGLDKEYILNKYKTLGFCKASPITDKYYNNLRYLKELAKEITFKDDFNEIKIDTYGKDDFIFIDPPFLSSSNKSYCEYSKADDQEFIIDKTKIFIDIYNLMKHTKAKVMLIINKNSINDYIFNEFYQSEYIRVYQLSKKKEILGIYTNY